ncbi:hypothetical protein Avbf_02186 [Armadillidium vulgare]|nr:hypothetical protein Avbf_02186 [Armadillidium vulgare]
MQTVMNNRRDCCFTGLRLLNIFLIFIDNIQIIPTAASDRKNQNTKTGSSEIIFVDKILINKNHLILPLV